jgi:hypothetical protein
LSKHHKGIAKKDTSMPMGVLPWVLTAAFSHEQK